MSPSDQLVSVVMPVRNALPYLHESIRSILEQTHRALELVIRDDGSTDGSTEALRDWARRDARIRLHESTESLGPAESSNWVVRMARSPIVARMDADDVSHPDRIRRQLAVLEADPGVVMVGSLCEGIDPRSRRVRGRDLWRLARRSSFAPFPHGSVVFRREVFDRVGGYRGVCDYWEDLDLFLRIAAEGRVVVLPDALYRYRFSESSTRLASQDQRVEQAVDLMFRCVDEHRRGRSYEPLMGAARPRPPARSAPWVFFSIGSTRLWSGRSPAMVRRLLLRGALGWDRPSAAALAWALFGAASPRLLRLILRGYTWGRGLQVRRRFVEGTAYEWRCGPGAAD